MIHVTEIEPDENENIIVTCSCKPGEIIAQYDNKLSDAYHSAVIAAFEHEVGSTL